MFLFTYANWFKEILSSIVSVNSGSCFSSAISCAHRWLHHQNSGVEDYLFGLFEPKKIGCLAVWPCGRVQFPEYEARAKLHKAEQPARRVTTGQASLRGDHFLVTEQPHMGGAGAVNI